jgi:hypothetical protein
VLTPIVEFENSSGAGAAFAFAAADAAADAAAVNFVAAAVPPCARLRHVRNGPREPADHGRGGPPI